MKEFSTLFLRLPKEYKDKLELLAKVQEDKTGHPTKPATIINFLIHKFLKTKEKVK